MARGVGDKAAAEGGIVTWKTQRKDWKVNRVAGQCLHSGQIKCEMHAQR